MNKHEFIEELEKKLGMDKEMCTKISDVLEDNFFIGRKNSEKTVKDLEEKLNLDHETADKVFNICRDVITKELKNKILHPFKSKD